MSDPAEAHDHRLLLLAAVAGMGAVIALPMSAVAPATLRVLVLALPTMLVIVAIMRGLAWLRNLALVLGVLVLLPLAPGLGSLGFVPAAVVLLGPLVAVVLVGAPLRDVDVPAAAGFLGSSTVAVIAGFASRGLAGAAGIVVGVAVVGLAVVMVRLTERR